MQRIYTRDTDLDVAIPVQHGDVVLIHEGYHPVVKAPGTNAYYLNFWQATCARSLRLMIRTMTG